MYIGTTLEAIGRIGQHRYRRTATEAQRQPARPQRRAIQRLEFYLYARNNRTRWARARADFYFL